MEIFKADLSGFFLETNRQVNHICIWSITPFPVEPSDKTNDSNSFLFTEILRIESLSKETYFHMLGLFPIAIHGVKSLKVPPKFFPKQFSNYHEEI